MISSVWVQPRLPLFARPRQRSGQECLCSVERECTALHEGQLEPEGSPSSVGRRFEDRPEGSTPLCHAGSVPTVDGDARVAGLGVWRRELPEATGATSRPFRLLRGGVMDYTARWTLSGGDLLR